MASRFYAKELFQNETEVERKERVSMARSYGHLKRNLYSNKPLTGKSLELALELVTPDPQTEKCAFVDKLNEIEKKLKSGQLLDEYEIHLIVDMLMVHARL